ncbi:energy transducer TonB [Thermodesulfovibrio hydrogeniphilus]
MLVFAIPISIGISEIYKEIELFVIDETDNVEKKQEIKKKSKIEQIVRRQPPQEVREENPIKPLERIENMSPASLPAEEEKKTEKSNPSSVVDRYEGEFGTAQGPKFLHREIPVYPLMARRLGKEGRVLLRLTIDEKGNLVNVEVLEGACCGFTESAVEAVKKSTFIPAKIDGKPVLSRALLSIKFTLRRD